MADPVISFEEIVTPEVVAWSRLLVDSYARVTGRHLLGAAQPQNDEHTAAALFKVRAIVVSHRLEAEPVLNYGNAAALHRWQLPWEEFVRTPSSATAEPAHRAERLAAFTRVREFGFIDDYAGVRIDALGNRFMMHDATIWEVVDSTGVRHGDAATFTRWTDL